MTHPRTPAGHRPRKPHLEHFKTEDCLGHIEDQLELVIDRLNLIDDRYAEGNRKTMTTLQDIKDLVTQTGTDAEAAAERVLAAIEAAKTAAASQIADLQAQVQALIDGNAGDVTPADLQGISDGLTQVDATIQGIAAETPPAEPSA